MNKTFLNWLKSTSQPSAKCPPLKGITAQRALPSFEEPPLGYASTKLAPRQTPLRPTSAARSQPTLPVLRQARPPAYVSPSPRQRVGFIQPEEYEYEYDDYQEEEGRQAVKSKSMSVLCVRKSFNSCASCWFLSLLFFFCPNIYA